MENITDIKADLARSFAAMATDPSVTQSIAEIADRMQLLAREVARARKEMVASMVGAFSNYRFSPEFKRLLLQARNVPCAGEPKSSNWIPESFDIPEE